MFAIDPGESDSNFHRGEPYIEGQDEEGSGFVRDTLSAMSTINSTLAIIAHRTLTNQ